nr:MAG TPA: hypothetical protein [Caudoviricetes sp.]
MATSPFFTLEKSPRIDRGGYHSSLLTSFFFLLNLLGALPCLRL